MNFLKNCKSYLIKEKPKKQLSKNQAIQNDYNIKKQPPNTKKSSSLSYDSFQLIVSDILNQDDSQSSDYFEQLKSSQPQHQEIQNIYVKDFIFITKQCQGRALTIQQWKQIIEKQDLSSFSKKNIYFSILKGIDFKIRKEVWDLLANVKQMKKLTPFTYNDLKNAEMIPQSQVTQIDKDVPRSKSVTKHLDELRNILIAYVNLSGKGYTQGMNLIAGCLLQLLSLDNDTQIEKQFQLIQEEQFQERVFWIFIGIMKHKRWQDLFVKDMTGLTQRLQVLQKLMAQHVPRVYQKLVDFQWDLTIFSQYYLTIMIYNSYKQLSKVILDLFLLDGEAVIHSLIIRMMKVQEEKITSFDDQGELMMYFKSGILKDCLNSIEKQKGNAKKLEDFQINFIKCQKLE